MKYTKPPLSLRDQVTSLEAKGLLIKNPQVAIDALSRVSFYRLRAYTYPFQDNLNPKHPFVKQVSIEDIIALYNFDRSLRVLIFDALERIEIALRTQIIYQLSIVHGSHWQTNPGLFKDTAKFSKHLNKLQEEIDRSDETFIKHYKTKYTSPSQPPSWMSLEVASMGVLSKFYQNLKDAPEKFAVAHSFGIKKADILENWMFCFSALRNICAHHARLWNRRMTAHIKLSYNTTHPFFNGKEISGIYNNKLYAALCATQYMLDRIEPNNDFRQRLRTLIASIPLGQEKEMGFTQNWTQHPFWN
ncbi:MAG: Abi family protein [Flavobacteriales bacterium]|jgi:abortive infection bacteriophage resistance protein